jgi:hypothetical protein
MKQDWRSRKILTAVILAGSSPAIARAGANNPNEENYS